jgi:hypothetical protein
MGGWMSFIRRGGGWNRSHDRGVRVDLKLFQQLVEVGGIIDIEKGKWGKLTSRSFVVPCLVLPLIRHRWRKRWCCGGSMGCRGVHIRGGCGGDIDVNI